jgi:GTP-binding protein Era
VKARRATSNTKRAKPEVELEGPTRTRSGSVAIVGRPNVGKSTLLNAALELPLAIVSPTPQTTRDTLLGVVHHRIDGDGGEAWLAEIALLDTPGLHRPTSALDRSMNRAARVAARDADVVVFVVDVPKLERAPAKRQAPAGAKPTAGEAASSRARTRMGDARGARPITPHPGDRKLLEQLGDGQPSLLVVNKIDRVKDKAQLLGLLEALSQLREFAAIVPISALRQDGVTRVLDEVARLLPEGPHRYGPDELTDKPSRYFASEYVREQVLLLTRQEVPHATAVTIDRWEIKRSLAVVSATVHVERPGHKKILVGSGGSMLRRIGTQARERLEVLVGHPVHLELFVRVTPHWRDTPSLLSEMGYGDEEQQGTEVHTGSEDPG